MPGLMRSSARNLSGETSQLRIAERERTRFLRRPMLVGCLGRCVALVVLAAASSHVAAQTYSYTTLAGRATTGCIDGAAGDARFHLPEGLAVDGRGNVYVADSGNHSIRQITPEGVVTTVAGGAGLRGRLDGAGYAAGFNHPIALAVDRAGTLFVSDHYNHLVRRISPAGVVTTLAGRAGVAGSADGPGPEARFNFPAGVAVDEWGNVFVADSGNAAIRRISATGVVTTIAGEAGRPGTTDGVGVVARFGRPFGLAIDAKGVLYVSDRLITGSSRSPTIFHSIRRISVEGTVTTVADSVRSPSLGLMVESSGPTGLAVDAAGVIYVGNPLRKIVQSVSLDGIVTTLAGQLYDGWAIDGPAAQARFSGPAGVALDSQGNLYVADSGSHSIRKVSTGGVVSTLAGPLTDSGRADGTGGLARFEGPRGVVGDGAGGLFVADTGNCTIRRITAAGVVTTWVGRAGVRGTADGVGSEARFWGPVGLAQDGQGGLIVTDSSSVRRISVEGIVTTIAGDSSESGGTDGVGKAARFFGLGGVVVDGRGNIVVADSGNCTIRQISPQGIVSTLAGVVGGSGSVDGWRTAARFSGPVGLAIDQMGNLFIADRGGSCAIRKLSPDGEVTTVAGAFGRSGIVDGIAGAARFSDPAGLAFDPEGNLFVADASNIRRISPSGTVTTVAEIGFGTYFGSANRRDNAAQFASFWGIAVGPSGVLSITDPTSNTLVRGVPQPDPPRLANVSVLTTLGPGEDAITLGVIVGGVGSHGVKPLLARAVGPALVPLGVGGVLADPRLEVYAGRSWQDGNDNWDGQSALTALFARVEAFPFASASSKDAALAFTPVTPRGTTVRVTGDGLTGGTVLAELYDATPVAEFTTTTPRFTNVSVLRSVGRGLTVGFIVGGQGLRNLLVRAVGPSLAAFGVSSALANPAIELFDGRSRSIASNDDWADPITAYYSAYDVVRAVSTQVGAFDISSGGSRDAALLVTLAPGSHTVQVRSVDGTDGLVLVEIYEVP